MLLSFGGIRFIVIDPLTEFDRLLLSAQHLPYGSKRYCAVDKS